jgi:uncharacterized protein (TIGR02145 family)
MKHIKTTDVLLSLFLSWSLCSCVNNLGGDTVKEGTTPISFSAKVSKPTTRVGSNGFNLGDQVGLYAVVSSSSLTGSRYIDNLKLEYTATNTLTPERTVFYPEGDVPLDFIAYYPYREDAVLASANTLDLQVVPNQHSDEDFASSDFLAARKTSVKSGSKTVSLTFKHEFAKLKFVLVPPSGEDLKDLLAANPTVLLTNMQSHCVYNMETDAITASSDKYDLQPHGSWKINSTDGCLEGKEVIVIPQNIVTGEESVVMEWGGRMYTCSLPDMEADPQKQYEIKITAKEMAGPPIFEGIVSGVEDWEDGADEETNNEDGSTEVHISALSFTQSNIYHLYSDGKPLFEICKEYLNTDALKSTALVIYPLSLTEEPDLAKGVLLQCSDSPNTKVGGSVSWNVKTNTVTLGEGTLDEIDYFYVTDEGKLTFTKPAQPQKMSVIANELREIRGGTVYSYPLVKIGTQYWMRTNLRATRYTNGNDIAAGTLLEGKPYYYKPKGKEYYFYSGEAILAGVVAPHGWKIPSTADCKLLDDYIGGDISLLKNGTWDLNGTAGTLAPVNNKTGFDAQPEGAWYTKGYQNEKLTASFWLMEDDGTIPANVPYLDAGMNEFGYMNSVLTSEGYQGFYRGLSVRCIKIANR